MQGNSSEGGGGGTAEGRGCRVIPQRVRVEEGELPRGWGVG